MHQRTNTYAAKQEKKFLSDKIFYKQNSNYEFCNVNFCALINFFPSHSHHRLYRI